MKKHLIILILLIGFFFTPTVAGKLKFPLFETESSFIYDMCLTANGKVLVCTDNLSLKAFNVSNRQLLSKFEGGHQAKILSVDVSPDSTLLVSGGADSLLIIRSFVNAEILRKIRIDNGKITSVRFSPDSRMVLVACSGSKAYLIRVADMQIVREFNESNGDLTAAAFNDAGTRIALAGQDKIIRIYDMNNFSLIAELKGHADWIRSVSFYNFDKYLISGADDRKVYQWNFSNPSQIKKRKLKSGNGWILSVDSENEDERKANTFVIGTMRGTVQIYHAFGSYRAYLDAPVSRVRMLRGGIQLEVVAATLGSGLVFLNAMDMKSK